MPTMTNKPRRPASKNTPKPRRKPAKVAAALALAGAGAMNGEAPQPPLIPMSAEEIHAAGRKLANLTRELDTMEREHAAQRTENKADRDELRKRVSNLAEQIIQQGR